MSADSIPDSPEKMRKSCTNRQSTKGGSVIEMQKEEFNVKKHESGKRLDY